MAPVWASDRSLGAGPALQVMPWPPRGATVSETGKEATRSGLQHLQVSWAKAIEGKAERRKEKREQTQRDA